MAVKEVKTKAEIIEILDANGIDFNITNITSIRKDRGDVALFKQLMYNGCIKSTRI